jgi:adenosylmethionine-8-amino-7-oxononanoate aminotransferase
MTKLLSTFFNKKKISIKNAKGIYFYTKSGKKITDLTSGYTGHAILGWGNKKILEAISKQSKKFCHIDYKVFDDENREKLASLILSNKKNKLDKVFLVGSSGAEACEAAMKMSYQYFYDLGFKEKKYFISRKQSYHGCTTHSLSIGDRPNLYFYQNILAKNCKKISEHNKYRYQKSNENDEDYAQRSAKDLEKKILSIGPNKVCAYIAETIAGGLVGDVPPNKNYWKKIRKVCDKYNVHLIIDEVWCGTGTSGKNFCIDWDDVTPDFVFISKTLAAGYGALSAVITRKKITDIIKKKSGQIFYSNTHQGHSLSVAAAYATQKIINNNKFLNEVLIKGNFLRKTITDELKNMDFFSNVRGRGLRNSIEYKSDNNIIFSNAIKKKMLQKNIFIDAKWHRICLPIALNISRNELEKNLDILIKIFKDVHENWPKIKKNKYNLEKFF